jgi:probable rRNA maturation factor
MTARQVSVQLEEVRTPVSRARLAAAVTAVLRAERAGPALVSVTLVTRRRIAAMNRRHLGHAGPTDVISFSFRDPVGAVIGDVYICPEVAAANARRFGRPVREELIRLVVHGTLHVLGHDHPDGEAREGAPMWRRQEQLVRRVLAG